MDDKMLYSLFRKQYAKIFSGNRVFKKINNRILDCALSAKGYNNWQNLTESGEKYFVKKYLSNKPIGLCIDIGANKGDYTRLLLEETNSKVVSFEPLPFSYKKLLENLSKFSDRCTFVNKGVGAQSEVLKIYYNEERSEHASFSEEVKSVDYVVNSNVLDINVTSLDDFCKLNNFSEIDLIKIDTEGFEKEVFEGAEETFTKLKPKFIQIEYNWHQLFRNTSINFFAEKLPNYTAYQLTFNGMTKIDPKHPFSNIYMFSNFVFIRKDCE